MNGVGLAPPLLLALAALLTVALIVCWLVLVPSKQLSAERRRHGTAASSSMLNRSATAATGAISGALQRRGLTERFANTLDRAGIRMEPADFLLLVGAGGIAGLAVGMVIGGPIVGFLLVFMTCVGAYFFVAFKADRRKSAFSDQLDDLLQLLASNLRAGHSILQAMNSVAQELEEPGATEMTRVVNQARVGRDLGDSLDEAAERMDSDDFRWVAQAIAIHRQVGGNLADVLDGVGETIRERGQIRRQVKALAAEGKLSAWILLALPFVVLLALSVLNPEYISALTSSLLGYVMIFAGLMMLTIGALWLRKVVEVKF